jgi:anti-sigma regulatory factor (Ser/Thr protein kinase)
VRLQRVDRVFPAEAMSAAGARTLIARSLADLPRESLEIVLLLTSELVTNAVRHGAGAVGLHVRWGGDDVRVEVEDQSPEWPVMRVADHAALKGRGLVLVDGLSSGWGVVPMGAGKKVWFTVEA